MMEILAVISLAVSIGALVHSARLERRFDERELSARLEKILKERST